MVLNLTLILYVLLFSSSILMILSNNPIYSVFFLISIFINTAVIFILYNVDFLGILLLLVYVGAIAILFLFIVMMLNIKKIENENNTYVVVGISVFFVVCIYFIYILFTTFFAYVPTHLLFDANEYSFVTFSTFVDVSTSTLVIKKIGVFLFLDYYYFLFFSGLLLLVSLMGAIFLTNFKKGYYTKTQYHQCFRKNNLLNTQLY